MNRGHAVKKGEDHQGPLVQVRSLRKVYEPSPLWMRFLLRTAIRSPVVALDDVSFEVKAGHICAVVGPNGAGKSTLFRVLTGLTTPTRGSATIAGLDVTREAFEVRKIVGFMPADDRSLWLRHTCRENLAFHGRLQGIPEHRLGDRIEEVLEQVGLGNAGDRAGFALSSGMRARLQLARALLHEPRVLILDEPTGSVDPVGSFQLLELIKGVAADGLSVLISSHRLDEIEALHDNVLLLDRGEMVYWGNLDVMRQTWEAPRVEISFEEDEDAGHAAVLLEKSDQVDVLAVDDRSVVLATGLPIGALLGILDGQVHGIRAIQHTRMRLQELLASMLGKGEAR